MNRNSSKSLLKTFSAISVIIVFGKVAGFVRQMVAASYFGATIETDLINLSQGLIANAEYVIAQTLITAFVAIYIHKKEDNNSDENKLASNTLTCFSIIIVGIVFIIFLFSPLLARVIAPTYSYDLAERLSEYIRLFSPVLILFTWTAIFRAILNANSKYLPGEIIGLIQSSITIVIIITLSGSIGEKALAVSFIAYSLVDTLYLAFCARKHWSFLPIVNFKDPGLIEIFKMMGPLLLGYSMIFINQQVDKIIVSGMESGTVTAMGYASTLSNLVTTFVSAFCMILFTKLTEHISAQRHMQAAGVAIKSVSLLIYVLLPITIITFAFSKNIVGIAFGRGAFEAEAISNASMALKGYCLMFIPYTMKSLFSRFLYGHKETKKPMINSTIGIFVNITLSIVLSRIIGVFGVTFATSFAEVVCAVLNYFTAKKYNGYLSMKEMKTNFIIILFGGITCICICAIIFTWISSLNRLIGFVLATLVVCTVYLLITWKILKSLLKKH